MSGLRGFASGAGVAMPTLYLGGLVGQKISEFFNAGDNMAAAAHAAGAGSSSLALLVSLGSFFGSSPFYTGVKVAIVVATVLYTGMQALASSGQNRVVEAVRTQGCLSKSTLWLVAGAVSGIVIAFIGSMYVHPAAGCFFGSLTAYAFTNTGRATA